MWDRGEITEEAARRFIPQMHSFTLPSLKLVAHEPEILSARTILDVGGGSGTFAVALAEAQFLGQYTLFDLPPVCKIADENLKNHNFPNFKCHPGNFFKDIWPAEQEVIFLSNILHDWPPTVCEFLIAKAFSATVPGGKFILHEMLLDDHRTGPRVPLLFLATDVR